VSTLSGSALLPILIGSSSLIPGTSWILIYSPWDKNSIRSLLPDETLASMYCE